MVGFQSLKNPVRKELILIPYCNVIYNETAAWSSTVPPTKGAVRCGRQPKGSLRGSPDMGSRAVAPSFPAPPVYQKPQFSERLYRNFVFSLTGSTRPSPYNLEGVRIGQTQQIVVRTSGRYS
jgi:hypothetical protein